VDSARQSIQNYVLSGGRVDDETNKLFIRPVYFVFKCSFLNSYVASRYLATNTDT
jgi:hypothetical protein